MRSFGNQVTNLVAVYHLLWGFKLRTPSELHRAALQGVVLALGIGDGKGWPLMLKAILEAAPVDDQAGCATVLSHLS